MPSRTSSTRPTSRASRWARYWSISLWRTETISSALNLMTASLDDLFPHAFQALADGGIVDPIAHAHHHAAEQIGIEPGVEQRLLVIALAQLSEQVFALVLRQRHGGADLHAHSSSPLVPQLPVGGEDWPDQMEPLVVVEHQKKVDEKLARPAAEDRLDQTGLVLSADGPAG